MKPTTFKCKSFLFIIFMATTHTVFSQDSIRLDFTVETGSDGKFVYNVSNTGEDLIKGQEYIFTLKNINTILFDVKLTAKSKTLNSDVPEILKGILPGVLSEDVFMGTDAAPKNKTMDTTSKDPFIATLNRRYIFAQTKFNLLTSILKRGKEYTRLIAMNPADFTGSLDKAKEMREIITNLLAYVNTPVKQDAIETISGIENFLLAEYNLLNDAVNGNPEVFEKPGILNNHALLHQYYLNLVANKGLYAKVAEFIWSSAEAKNSVEKKYKHQKELTTLAITVINRVTKDTAHTETFEYFTKGSLDFDFTTGFFGGSLYTRDYFVDTDANGNKIISREDNPGIDLGIGALAHVNYRITSAAKLGVAAGAYLSTIDGKVRYLFGPSVVLGRKKQFAISAGWARSKVTQLSGKISTNGIDADKTLPVDITAVPVYEKWASGMFASLTYNLIRK